MNMRILVLEAAVLLAMVSCAGRGGEEAAPTMEYASFFSIPDDSTLVSISPYDGSADTLRLEAPVRSLVCMSSSHVAFLDALGLDSLVSAVSGLKYISSPQLRSRTDVADVGYDHELDYERILAIGPDLVLAYSVSSVLPPYVSRLRSLGVKVFLVNEHLEDHPLARAEYVKLFGALGGRRGAADSLFAQIRERYLALRREVPDDQRVKLLLNVPYAEQWYVPGKLNYMSRLIEDAGGTVLGAKEGRHDSSVMSLEQAYLLSRDADIWLNPGNVSTRSQLEALNPMFSRFGVPRIYNNTLRVNSGGGNDFWENGTLRPDLILEDLVGIFAGSGDSFNYYIEVQ